MQDFPRQKNQQSWNS